MKVTKKPEDIYDLVSSAVSSELHTITGFDHGERYAAQDFGRPEYLVRKIADNLSKYDVDFDKEKFMKDCGLKSREEIKEELEAQGVNF